MFWWLDGPTRPRRLTQFTGSCFIVAGIPNGFVFKVRLCSVPFSLLIVPSYASSELRVSANSSSFFSFFMWAVNISRPPSSSLSLQLARNASSTRSETIRVKLFNNSIFTVFFVLLSLHLVGWDLVFSVVLDVGFLRLDLKISSSALSRPPRPTGSYYIVRFFLEPSRLCSGSFFLKSYISIFLVSFCVAGSFKFWWIY